jgi:hypothetical protein
MREDINESLQGLLESEQQEDVCPMCGSKLIRTSVRYNPTGGLLDGVNINSVECTECDWSDE